MSTTLNLSAAGSRTSRRIPVLAAASALVAAASISVTLAVTNSGSDTASRRRRPARQPQRPTVPPSTATAPRSRTVARSTDSPPPSVSTTSASPQSGNGAGPPARPAPAAYDRPRGDPTGGTHGHRPRRPRGRAAGAPRGARRPACAIAIVLEGEAGIGKTALWQAGIAEAEAARDAPPQRPPGEAETGLSHAALGDLLAPVVDAVRDEIPAPQRPRARRRAPAGRAGRGTVDPSRSGRPRSPCCARPRSMRPCSSPSTTSSGSTRRPPPHSASPFGGSTTTPCCCSRPEAPAPARNRSTRAGRRAAHADRRRAARARRAPAAAAAQAGRGLPRPALVRLAEVSGGNPYYALELARAARPPGGWCGGERRSCTARRDLCRPAGPPERTAAQDERGAGNGGRDGPPHGGRVGRALDAESLDDAFAAGIVHEERDTIRFEHPLLAEAAYRMLLRRGGARFTGGCASSPPMTRSAHVTWPPPRPIPTPAWLRRSRGERRLPAPAAPGRGGGAAGRVGPSRARRGAGRPAPDRGRASSTWPRVTDAAEGRSRSPWSTSFPRARCGRGPSWSGRRGRAARRAR